jgi:hypothetical protein
MVLLAFPSQLQVPAFAVDWGAASRAWPLYRAPWEAPQVQALPPGIRVPRRPLPASALRVAVRRDYWFGAVPDFLMTLGFWALSRGSTDPQRAWASMESTLELPPSLQPTSLPPPDPQVRTEIPPLRATLLPEPPPR